MTASRTTFAISTVALLVLVGLLFTPVTIVRAVTTGGDSLACVHVNANSTIVLIFTHSMYGGDVRETYRLGGNGALRRTRMVTDLASAAEYYAWDGAVTRVDDGYEVVVPEEEFDALAIRVDRIGDHRLEIDGVTYALAAMVPEPLQVQLSTVHRPLIDSVFRNGC